MLLIGGLLLRMYRALLGLSRRLLLLRLVHHVLLLLHMLMLWLLLVLLRLHMRVLIVHLMVHLGVDQRWTVWAVEDAALVVDSSRLELTTRIDDGCGRVAVGCGCVAHVSHAGW